MEAGPGPDVVRRLREGDDSAFEAFYEEWHRRLFAYLLRLAGRREVAEDLAEETWLRAVRGISDLRDDSRLVPWVFAIARNLWLSHRRAVLLDTERIGELRHLDTGPAAPSPFEEAAAGEMERRLERALAELPVALREAVLLVGVHGMKPADAAVVCGVAPEAFRQRLSRGRALLARSLREGERGSPGGSP